MIILNKVYTFGISYVIQDRLVEHYGDDYSLEGAIKYGLRFLKEEFIDIFDREPINDEELYNFINNEIEEFNFYINVISGNRKLFDTYDEILEYLKDNINNISNENLYDFLLSLVEYDQRFYDIRGNQINNFIATQVPLKEDNPVCICNVQFTEESCKDGKFQFSYNRKGIDTLYNLNTINSII